MLLCAGYQRIGLCVALSCSFTTSVLGYNVCFWECLFKTTFLYRQKLSQTVLLILFLCFLVTHLFQQSM